MFEVADGGEERVRLLEPLDRCVAYFHITDDGLTRCLDQDGVRNRIGAECPGCKANAENWNNSQKNWKRSPGKGNWLSSQNASRNSKHSWNGFSKTAGVICRNTHTTTDRPSEVH